MGISVTEAAIKAMQDTIDNLPDGTECAKAEKKNVIALEKETSKKQEAVTSAAEVVSSKNVKVEWEYYVDEVSLDPCAAGRAFLDNTEADIKAKKAVLDDANRLKNEADIALKGHQEVLNNAIKVRDEAEK